MVKVACRARRNSEPDGLNLFGFGSWVGPFASHNDVAHTRMKIECQWILSGQKGREKEWKEKKNDPKVRFALLSGDMKRRMQETVRYGNSLFQKRIREKVNKWSGKAKINSRSLAPSCKPIQRIVMWWEHLFCEFMAFFDKQMKNWRRKVVRFSAYPKPEVFISLYYIINIIISVS